MNAPEFEELFTRDQRGFSSGCIRVENPLELAALLLDGQDDWSPARIQEAVGGRKTQTVFLDVPVAARPRLPEPAPTAGR